MSPVPNVLMDYILHTDMIPRIPRVTSIQREPYTGLIAPVNIPFGLFRFMVYICPARYMACCYIPSALERMCTPTNKDTGLELGITAVLCNVFLAYRAALSVEFNWQAANASSSVQAHNPCTQSADVNTLAHTRPNLTQANLSVIPTRRITLLMLFSKPNSTYPLPLHLHVIIRMIFRFIARLFSCYLLGAWIAPPEFIRLWTKCNLLKALSFRINITTMTS